MNYCCTDTDRFFDLDKANKYLERYRKKGPVVTTRVLIDALRDTEPRSSSLLDIGGGIGAIHHELGSDAISQVSHVDISEGYLHVAREEADRLGTSDRITFVHGDIVDVAPTLPETDIVTLDRVVCCYPEIRRLLEASTSRCRGVIGLSWPRERWYVRLIFRIDNALRALRKKPFRSFVHSVSHMESLIEKAGFKKTFDYSSPVWQIVLFERNGTF
jgi:2-polyprenyl-3-methyl-5-hydroxy-6-metoxy-1,4-benzoquinol methylase